MFPVWEEGASADSAATGVGAARPSGRNGWKAAISNRLLTSPMMPDLLPLSIIAFFSVPFAISGFRQTWRGAAVILALFALYTAYVWLRPLPARMRETDRLGAAGWSMILLILLVATTVSFAGGFVSVLRPHRRR